MSLWVNEILSLKPADLADIGLDKDSNHLELRAVKKLVGLLGGNLMVKSEVNVGTTVDIVLEQKIVETEKTIISRKLDSYEQSINANKRIMVVDDDAKELAKITSILEKHNANVSGSLFGRDCIEKIGYKHKFDLIILDDETSTYSALEVLKELKKNKKFNIPVVVMIDDNKERISTYMEFHELERKPTLAAKAFQCPYQTIKREELPDNEDTVIGLGAKGAPLMKSVWHDEEIPDFLKDEHASYASDDNSNIRKRLLPYMEAVGYDMYIRLLSEAVNELETEGEGAQDRRMVADSLADKECLIDVQLSAHIPESYIESVPQRLGIYRRIADIKNEADADDVIDELIDRFGEPPESVRGLITVSLLRNTAASFGVYEIKQKGDSLLLFVQKVDMSHISRLAGAMRGRIMVSATDKPYITVKKAAKQSPLGCLNEIFTILRLPEKKSEK